MLLSRLLFAAGLACALPACSSGGSSSSGTGAHGTTTTTTGGAGGATTGSTTSTSSMTGTGGAGPADAGDLDAADAGDALGKGGLPKGAICGDSYVPDGGGPIPDAGPPHCGLGLACCYPCTQMNCKETCVVACSPQQTGCVNGCIPQI